MKVRARRPTVNYANVWEAFAPGELLATRRGGGKQTSHLWARCLILQSNYRFNNILVYVHRKKTRKNISENTSSGKHTEIPKGIANAIEAEKAEPSREVDPTEDENLDDLSVDFLRLNRTVKHKDCYVGRGGQYSDIGEELQAANGQH